ncbi:hypothetical protein AD998_21905 [bacterium 336/3]|nr:hypothetical protein AD998_21905 [bacterium 336/3]
MTIKSELPTILITILLISVFSYIYYRNRKVNNDGIETIGIIIREGGISQRIRFKVGDSIHTTNRKKRSFNSIRTGEKYYIKYDKNDYDNVKVDINKPYIDESFKKSDMIQNIDFNITNSIIKFKFRPNSDFIYYRELPISDSLSTIIRNKRFNKIYVKYKPEDPFIAYIVVE